MLLLLDFVNESLNFGLMQVPELVLVLAMGTSQVVLSIFSLSLD